MYRIILAAIMVALLTALAACGEASYEDVGERQRALEVREAEVERNLCEDERIDGVLEKWQRWYEREVGNIDDFDDLSNNQKMDVLNKFEAVLDDLEDIAEDVC